MVAKFKNVSISGFGTGISLANNGGDVEFDNIKIYDCKTAIEQRDPPSLFQSIGLPTDLPPAVLLEALKILTANPNTTNEDKTTLLTNSKIGPYLQNTANFSTTIAMLIGLSASPLCAQVISWLSSLR